MTKIEINKRLQAISNIFLNFRFLCIFCARYMLQYSHLVDAVNLTKSNSLFFCSPIYYSAMHTTHATRLFLDVTRHVSRTRIHMRVNTFHVVPQHATVLFIFLLQREKRYCTVVYCKSTKRRASIYIEFLFHLFFFFNSYQNLIYNNI